MDIFSAILIVTSLIILMAQEFGINQLHLAMVFMVNLVNPTFAIRVVFQEK